MHVPDRLAAIVKQTPFAPVTFNRIDSNTKNKMSRFADQKVKPFAPDHLTPTRRLIRSVEETDATFLLQVNDAGQDNWNRANAYDQKRAAR